jgi:hypothetical protein
MIEVPEAFIEVPETFPNKGKYRTYSKSWDPLGWADSPQYSGQQPLNYPEEWLPLRCFLASLLKN